MGMEARIDLDDREAVSAVDAGGMLEVVERFPGQVREALATGPEGGPLPSADGVDSVLVLGMGGSGVSGDVAGALGMAAGLRVPLVTVKGYRVPGFVSNRTLVFAVSYSGNTEETLDCLGQAMEAGARAVAITSGGRLAEKAAEAGAPLFRIPGGYQPRASLGYLFVPIISALERMGLVSGLVGMLEGAVAMLEARSREYGGSTGVDANPCKRLAWDLAGFLPVVYGSEGPLEVAAARWKAQLNENSKVPAFHNYFPELNHNETVGWQNLEDTCRSSHIVVLRDGAEHPRVKKRIEITLELLEGHVGRVTQVFSRGANAVERMLDAVYFGDFTSVYLALALGQDPTPVTRIELLKKRLAESGGE